MSAGRVPIERFLYHVGELLPSHVDTTVRVRSHPHGMKGYARVIDRGVVILVFGIFVSYYGLHCFKSLWAADLLRYCAGISRLHADLLYPAHEVVSAPGNTTILYTPYLVATAALGKLFGATPYLTLQYAGIVNLLIYVLAIWFFFRTFSLSSDRWIPAGLFLIVSLFMRARHFGWSSETSLITFQYIQAYPSTLAWSAALTAFALFEHYLRSPKGAILVALSFIVWFTFLSHILTGSWMVGILCVRAFWELGKRQTYRPGILGLGSFAVGVLATLAWPYFDILGLASFTNISVSPFGEQPVKDLEALFWLGVPAMLGLALFKKHWFMWTAFIATWLAFFLFRCSISTLEIDTSSFKHSFYNSRWRR